MARKRRRSARTARKSNAAGLNVLSLCFTRQLDPVVEGEGSGSSSSSCTAAATNLVFSPVSVYATLALLAAGAHGGTLQELLDALGGESRDDVAAFARRVAERSQSGGGPTVAFACGAWFRGAAAASYNAEARAVDFSNDPEKAVREINGRLAAATNKHIDSILDPSSSVNALTSLVLSSAIYFKGRWEAPFSRAHTVVGKFHRLDCSSVDVPFMCSVLKLPYRSPAPAPAPRKGSSSENSKAGDDDDDDVVVPKYSMCVFLPDERDGLAGLVDKIASGPGFWHYRLPTTPVPVGDFRLPKFRLSASGSIMQVLRDGMAIRSAFVAGEADLANMAAKRDEDAGGTPLYVGDVCHKAALEVNEGGGAAAIGAAASYMLCASVAQAR